MKVHHSIGKLAVAIAAVLALGSASPAAAQDDSALFSASVPPNVLMVVDNSGSMNEIMWHPSFDESASTCAMFGWSAPGVSTSPDTPYQTEGSGHLPDATTPTALGSRYTCDPNTKHCRFQLSERSASFTSTGTVTCQNPPSGSRCGTNDEGTNRLASGQTTCRSGYITRRFCGNTRRLYIDGETACKDNATWYSEEYLEWYFSDAADAHFSSMAEGNTSIDQNQIYADRNGTYFIDGVTYPLYKRTRITAAKEVARDVLFRVNTNCAAGTGNRTTLACPGVPPTGGDKNAVRFGVAQFDGSNGGYVRAAIDPYSANKTLLDGAIDNFDADASTPLAETLFQTYTYLMSRDAAYRPLGSDGSSVFPAYNRDTALGGAPTATPPPDPLDCNETLAGSQPCTCQKNFVLLITDGAPNNDFFNCHNGCASPTRTPGFDNFMNLIGDYAPDPVTDPPGIGNPENTGVVGAAGYLYLDDVTKWMHDTDFRLDLPNDNGPQTIDVYTVGFNIPDQAENLLQRAADHGNGEFYRARTAIQVADALVAAIQSIMLKSQAFTAATVPATRTAYGGQFYNSLFVPSNRDGYWEGHLQSWTIEEDGEIRDQGGQCAFQGNPTPCKGGMFDPLANPWWDAAEEVPAPATRDLKTSFNATPMDFTVAAIDETHLGLTTTAPVWPAVGALYPYTAPSVPATSVGALADMIVQNVRGCRFGTGVGAVACQLRTNRAGQTHLLGDIFHSNPIVVGRPPGVINEPSYQAFATAPAIATRDQVIMAGANDGIFRFFDAGTWQTPPAPAPPGYDPGDGTELAGFIPYTARGNVRQLALDSATRDYYYTDGSPVAADVWLYGSATQAPTAKLQSEWRTIVMAGMRQGGNQYFALDVTDPAAASYPGYLWEFPTEGDSAAIKAKMGQSWSEPVITKVKVAVNGDVANPKERWVAIFAGGYDRTGDPNSTFYAIHATAGRSLTMLDLKTGTILAQKAFVDTAAATDPALVTYDPDDPERSMLFAMPSSPGVIDLDFDGFADIVYVGDLGGNMWKWVIRAVGHDAVNSADTSTDQPAWWFGKFYEDTPYPAPPAGGTRHYRSFFFSPSATLKDNVLWLAFGSGERTDLQFPGDTSTDEENNRFYALKDLDPYEQTPEPTPMTQTSPHGVFQLTATSDCDNIGSSDGFYVEGAEGEKFVTNSDILNYNVIFASYQPTVSTDPCTAGGTARLYAFKVYCGPGMFEDASGNPVTNISLGNGMPTDPRVSLSGTSGEIFINKNDRVESIDAGGANLEKTGQSFWRELFR